MLRMPHSPCHLLVYAPLLPNMGKRQPTGESRPKQSTNMRLPATQRSLPPADEVLAELNQLLQVVGSYEVLSVQVKRELSRVVEVGRRVMQAVAQEDWLRQPVATLIERKTPPNIQVLDVVLHVVAGHVARLLAELEDAAQLKYRISFAFFEYGFDVRIDSVGETLSELENEHGRKRRRALGPVEASRFIVEQLTPEPYRRSRSSIANVQTAINQNEVSRSEVSSIASKGRLTAARVDRVAYVSDNLVCAMVCGQVMVAIIGVTCGRNTEPRSKAPATAVDFCVQAVGGILPVGERIAQSRLDALLPARARSPDAALEDAPPAPGHAGNIMSW